MHEPPLGFRGLDPSLPVRMYRRHLPHWRQEGATYFVTFRLADALPQCKLDELKVARLSWEMAHPGPTEDDWREYTRTVLKKTERWLDEGYGGCFLAHQENEQIIAAALKHFDGTRYALSSYVVMPNHVHLAVRPAQTDELEDLVKGWKLHSAREINHRKGRGGTLWQEGYFDRIIRDSAHLRQVLNYIRENPKKAGVMAKTWLTPAWQDWLEC